MLVIRRKVNESLFISEIVKVTVLSIEGQRVKLGIEAPDNILVVREELVKQKEESDVKHEP